MTHHPIATGILLGIAVAVAILFATGMAFMRDAYQKLHFATPIVSFSAGLIAVAVWIEDKDPQARVKAILIALVLFVMNAILSHATARAIRVRQAGHWEVRPEEHIPIKGHPESRQGPVTEEEEPE